MAVEHRIAFRLARRLVDAPGSLATKKIAAALVAVADVLEPGGPA